MSITVSMTKTKQWLSDDEAPLSEQVCKAIARDDHGLVYKDGIVEADPSNTGFHKLLDFIERYQDEIDQ